MRVIDYYSVMFSPILLIARLRRIPNSSVRTLDYLNFNETFDFQALPNISQSSLLIAEVSAASTLSTIIHADCNHFIFQKLS
jgi:hypothetical protein